MTDFATQTKYSAAEYIETYTGRAFYPLCPDLSMFSIIDIAHALSLQCRYAGHTAQFYSTAQHCCVLASYVENVMKGSSLDCLQILMHDAAEAYLLDIPRPIKQFMPEYRQWDHNIQMLIRQWLGLAEIAIPDWQDEIDSRVINDERAQLMSDSGNDWGHRCEPLKVKCDAWPAPLAEYQFLFRYAAYMFALHKTPVYMHERWQMTGEHLLARGSDDSKIESLVEVDLLGGVGRVKLRSDDGMLVRDPEAGKIPRAATKWVHGHFEVIGLEKVAADV